MRLFSIWQDYTTKDYEIVAWHEGQPTVVQSRIKTELKARRALEIWRTREGDRRINGEQ